MARKVYAHLCTWFKTKEYSGHWEMWNSDYKQNPHDPNVILHNGKRDIAANCYPLTDVYDSSDPDIVEYQFLLMKMSGIDGVIVDWDGTRLNEYRHKTLVDILPYFERYNMELVICFEEWAGYEPKDFYPTREKQIEGALNEVKWLFENIANKSYYASFNGKKPVLIFRKKPDLWFNSGEFKIISDYISQNGGSVFMPEYCEDAFDEVSDGRYFWVGGFDETNYNSIEFRNKLLLEFVNGTKNRKTRNQPAIAVGSVIPGFDDTCVWGWGEHPRIAPRYNSKRFENDWKISIDNGIDIVQLITWNDWNEGSNIEPSDTFGYRYLELNKKYSAIFKNINDEVPDEALRLPLEIYKLRKDKNSSNNRNELDSAVDSILNCEYSAALEIVKRLSCIDCS